jgi:hypothetical protein
LNNCLYPHMLIEDPSTADTVAPSGKKRVRKIATPVVSDEHTEQPAAKQPASKKSPRKKVASPLIQDAAPALLPAKPKEAKSVTVASKKRAPRAPRKKKPVDEVIEPGLLVEPLSDEIPIEPLAVAPLALVQITAALEPVSEPMPTQVESIPVAELLQQRFVQLRGCRTMLDVDAACLYGVPLSDLQAAVAQHPHRFPAEFVFALSPEEQAIEPWAAQCQHAFTELGMTMLACVLDSAQARAVNLALVHTLIEMCGSMVSPQAADARESSPENALSREPLHSSARVPSEHQPTHSDRHTQGSGRGRSRRSTRRPRSVPGEAS